MSLPYFYLMKTKTGTETISRKQLELDYEFLAEKVCRLEKANDELRSYNRPEFPEGFKRLEALAENAALCEDKERLNWLGSYDWSHGFGDEVLYFLIQKRIWNGRLFFSLRSAVDAARKESLKF